MAMCARCAHVQRTAMMYVKLSGPSHIEIRTEIVVEVSATLAMSVDDFYNAQSTFVANVARVLGIDPRRIRVATIVPGRRLLSLDENGRQLLQSGNAKARILCLPLHSGADVWQGGPCVCPRCKSMR